jgi:Ca2+-binding EF-hand superfamily protein
LFFYKFLNIYGKYNDKYHLYLRYAFQIGDIKDKGFVQEKEFRLLFKYLESKPIQYTLEEIISLFTEQ